MLYKKFNNKLGQMKIQQMAFMLIAVTLFFALAGLFVVIIIFSDLRGSAELLEEKNALLLVSKLADSAEFSCGAGLGTARVNCIDSDKVMALKENIAKYVDFWQVSGIEIQKIPVENNVECTIENYPECGKITILETNEGTVVSNFVALCRKDNVEGQIQSKCGLGILIVTYNG